MTDVGDYILVESDEAQHELPALLEHVMAGRHVRICKDGRTVAEIQPPAPAPLDAKDLQTDDPDLKVVFSPSYDPTEGLSEDDWPEHSR